MKAQNNPYQKSLPKRSKPKKTGGGGMARAVREEQDAIIIDYRVEQPKAPNAPVVPSSHDWANLQEGLKFQVEAERQRAIALAYRYLTPPK